MYFNNNMNAKSIISGKINEAGDTQVPPQPGGPRPPGARPPHMRPPVGRIPGGPSRLRGLPGEPFGGEGAGEDEQPGQFTPRERSQLKDVLILILAEMLHSPLDREIGEALINGQELSQGQLQHILDEARNANLPPTHGALMQKIFTQLQS